MCADVAARRRGFVKSAMMILVAVWWQTHRHIEKKIDLAWGCFIRASARFDETRLNIRLSQKKNIILFIILMHGMMMSARCMTIAGIRYVYKVLCS